MKIVPLSHEYHDDVLRLHESFLADPTKLQKSRFESGFLINPLSSSKLQEILDLRGQHCLVALSDAGELLGYAIGFSVKGLSYMDPEYAKKLMGTLQIKSIDPERIFYHLYVASTKKEKGIGQSLMTFQLNYCKKQEYQAVICEILHSPIQNITSINFHKKYGFEFANLIIPQELSGVTLGWAVYTLILPTPLT